jgi:hypothetical protein
MRLLALRRCTVTDRSAPSRRLFFNHFGERLELVSKGEQAKTVIQTKLRVQMSKPGVRI